MKIPVHTPKFRRTAKLYPLTRFRLFLAERYADNTVKTYVTAMRQLLFHLGEGREQVQTWRDVEAVKAYFTTLNYGKLYPTRTAFNAWLSFTNDASLHGAASTRTVRAMLAAAVRTFMSARERGMPRMEVADLHKFRWVNYNRTWLLTREDVLGSEYYLPPHLVNMGNIIRAWGEVEHGAHFLPAEPGSNAPMAEAQIRKLIDNALPENVARPLEHAMDTALEEANAKLRDQLHRAGYGLKPKNEPKPIEIDNSLVGGSKVLIVNGEFTTDRSSQDAKDFDNFKIPDDA